MKNDYLLKAHDIYYKRSVDLNNKVKLLKEKLSAQELKEHETVKLASRVYKATFKHIPANPNHIEFRLKGDLKKYRRYKQGLKRYRLFFCFSNNPKIILYIYLNNEKNLRKEGDKNDPYQKFLKFINQGVVSHDPNDPNLQKWIKNYLID